MNGRDRIILRKIVQYVDEITFTLRRFELDYDKFGVDFVAKNAIAMCVLQIGELVGKLSEDLKGKYHAMPWAAIKAMRNVAAHNYGAMDIELLWETATGDVLVLKDYCEEILEHLDE